MTCNDPTTGSDASTADQPVVARRHDWTGPDPVAVTIVEALGETGRSPSDEGLCLNDVVDPEALDRLFRPTASRRARGSVRFRFAGHEVTVRADGQVVLEPRAGGEPTLTGESDVVE
jgi:hypothetical protein